MLAVRKEGVKLCHRCLLLCSSSSLRSPAPIPCWTQIGTQHVHRLLPVPAAFNSFSTSSVNFVEKEVEEDVKLNIEENPYFDKYREKIKDLQRSSPAAFQEKVDQIEEEMRKDRAFIRQQLEEAEAEAMTKGSLEGKTFPPESLDSIMKTELVKEKSTEEIEEIWKEYHKKKDCVYAVMKAIDYDDVRERAGSCPAFLYPLPRGDGYEFFFAMISGKAVYFTPLILYQRHGENAPPCLTLAHFTEFKHDKDIVLMSGQYDDKILKCEEALNLVRQMTLYYNRRSAERFNLVRIFNLTPEKFNPLDVVNEYQEIVKFLQSAQNV